MKKSAKLISMLLVLTMLLGIIPMAVAAGTDVSLGRTSLYDVKLTKAETPTGATLNQTLGEGPISKDINERGLYKRLPRNTVLTPWTTTDYLPVQYVITADSVELSDPEIIGELQFSLEPGIVTGWKTAVPCIEFDYKAIKNGSTDVTLKFFYKFDPRSGLTGWYYDVVTFTVHVSNAETQKPDQPDEHDVYNQFWGTDPFGYDAAISFWCNESSKAHHTSFDDLTEIPGAYSFGEVVPNENTKYSSVQYPWMCEMQVYSEACLDAYNYVNQGRFPTHYLRPEWDSVTTVYWFYSAAENKWLTPYQPPIVIDITHTAPVAPEYTVTYTDGVNGEAFANQSYTVKSGEATPAFDGTPAREGYVFLGWEPEVAETVTGNATYTAKWEEALTSVTLKRIGSGNLFFLGDTLTLRATANTAANITLNLDHAAFKLTSQETSEDGKTTTFVYTVKKIAGSWMRLNIIATATKGTQEPVKSANLSVEVNLRNRIHVKITENGQPVTDAAVQLMHKYSKWNTCPMLKYDEAKGEYVMKSPWDLSNQPYSSLKITVDGEEYTVDKDKFGEALANVVTRGTEEIYVEYKIVSPIDVEIYVNDKLVATKTYKGSEGDTPDYRDFYWVISDQIRADGKMVMSQATECDGTTLAFGSCKKVKVKLYTYLTGITATGDDYVFDNSGITATIDGIEWATGGNDSGSTDSGISATAPDFSFDN